jgi:N-acetylglucosaminyl-diphospho-decaprenol L-rhamnosyltransferase
MVSIIIANYNSSFSLEKCVNSIYEKLFIYDFEVIIVDNNSSDESKIFLLNEINRSKVIFNVSNFGFAKACNIGAENSIGNYLLFLNPDTKIDKLNLFDLCNLYEGDKNIGIIGIKQYDVNRKISKSCAKFPSISQYLFKILGLTKLFPQTFQFRFLNIDYNQSQYVDQVIGSFLFLKKSLFFDFNGFDEQFFVYYEEMDLAFRMRCSGYLNYYFSEMQIFHEGGGTTKNMKGLRLFYSWQSRLKYFRKHKGIISYVLISIITGLFEPFLRIFIGLITFNLRSSREAIYAVLRLIKNV